MMLTAAQRLKLSSRLSPLYIVRSLVFAILCFIAMGCRYGRFFERSFPELIPFIPYTGLFILLLLIFSLLSFRIPNLIKLKHTVFSRPVLLLVAAFVIILFCSERLNELPIERIHLLKYTCLTFFLYYSFADRRNHRRIIFIAATIAAVIGTSEEFAQRWMPERIFDPKDLLLNLLAVMLGTILLQIIHLISQAKIST